MLDLTFDLGKNVINDALHLAIRVDTDKIPGTLLRAYTKIETDARAQTEPERLPDQGPARRRPRRPPGSAPRPRPPTAGSAAWRITRSSGTARSNVLYAGVTSASVLDRLLTLFRETFDRTLEPITAGSLAQTLAAARGEDRLGRGLRPGRVRRRGRQLFLASPGRTPTPPAATSGATSS